MRRALSAWRDLPDIVFAEAFRRARVVPRVLHGWRLVALRSGIERSRTALEFRRRSLLRTRFFFFFFFILSFRLLIQCAGNVLARVCGWRFHPMVKLSNLH